MTTQMLARFALAFALLVCGLSPGRAAALEKLTFETATGPHTFMVEVAVTPEEREVGLMYRRSMPADHGMLFDFGKSDEIAMWMQNTYLSLDMVFVTADGRVRRVERATQPLSTRVIPSEGPVRYVVELVAGAAERIGLKPGDRVVHPRIAQTDL
ncbi:DUF192 domain-containing protein [Hansschlegelia beijingensis]|uniref:DUF192 domain-containing protein n=1 Tax=Hansschlegelia beijingensis TaxID=1133344 RepID=A0A7W6GDE1_9HYPH|nr:DUF192 domain-containing protein [Hansschlegelia beijingensis]MBB3971731.1 hypothetical protein [Hansschlegelia beijingensis]